MASLGVFADWAAASRAIRLVSPYGLRFRITLLSVYPPGALHVRARAGGAEGVWSLAIVQAKPVTGGGVAARAVAHTSLDTDVTVPVFGLYDPGVLDPKHGTAVRDLPAADQGRVRPAIRRAGSSPTRRQVGRRLPALRSAV